jgi:hypothetical protein
MGRFNWREVRKHLDGGFTDIAAAVETGTLFGDSAHEMAQHFKEVHTVELNKQLYLRAIARFVGTPVKVYFGNSAEVLAQLAPRLAAPTIFYLDAHWSGDTSTNWQQSNWKGYRKGTIDTAFVGDRPTPEAQVPLAEELRAIIAGCRHKCVIYIDDMDKFGDGGVGLKNKAFAGEDWSHLSVALLKNIVAPRLVDWDEVTVGEEKQLFITLRPAVKTAVFDIAVPLTH